MGLPQRQIQTTDSNSLFNRLYRKEAKIAVIGLGAEGLSLALQMASNFRVIGFDADRNLVEQIQLQKDPNKKLSHFDFTGKDFFATDIENLLHVAQFYIIAVSITTENKKPNLVALKKAIISVAKHLKKGDTIALKNNIYSRHTQKVIRPILEEISGLNYNTDFQIEIIPEHTYFENTNCNSVSVKRIHPKTSKTISEIYELTATTKNHKVTNNITSTVLKQIHNTNKNSVDFMVSKISDVLQNKKLSNRKGTILVKGITTKKNESNICNSKSAQLCLALLRKGFTVVVQDNHAYPSEVENRYGIELTTSTNQRFDVIVLAVDHDNYKNLTATDYSKNARIDTIFLNF